MNVKERLVLFYSLLIFSAVFLFAFSIVNPDSTNNTTEFLITSAEAHRVGMEQGKLAIERGTRPEIREYGALMMKDQELMLQKIQQLAVMRQVSLPVVVCEKKMNELNDLRKTTGEDFDFKFIRMVKIGYKQEVGKFRKAINLPDDEVKALAAEYLPMIESHLEQLKQVRITLNKSYREKELSES